MKEKMNREIRIKVQQSLYTEFSQICEENFKTVSIVIRELMTDYVRKQKDKYE